MPKKFLCVGEKYEKDGEEKIAWKRIGEIFTGKNEKEYAKLYMHPGMLISVFVDEPQKPKEEAF
jgi:hypothetical protein